MAERNLAKVEVAGSNPVVRSAVAPMPPVKPVAPVVRCARRPGPSRRRPSRVRCCAPRRLAWTGLAAFLLLGAAAGCSSDEDGSSAGEIVVTEMEIGGRVVEVEQLPHLQGELPFPLPTVDVGEPGPLVIEDLGPLARGLALSSDHYLIVTAAEPGDQCLALFGRETGVEATACGEVAGDQQGPLTLRSASFLALTNLPAAAVVAEFGGVYRSIEHGFVYFEDAGSVNGVVRYFNADGEQLSADGSATLPTDVALVGSQGTDLAELVSGADFAGPDAETGGFADEVARLRQQDRINDVRRWPLEVERDAQVKECMQERGFDYVALARAPRPLIPAPDLLDLFEYAAQLVPSSYAYRTHFGYGVSTLDAYIYVAAPPLIDTTQSAAENEQFNNALLGTEERAGCMESASDAVGLTNLGRDEEKAGYRTVERLARERANSLESYTAAEMQWADCAQDAGFVFAHPDEVSRYFEERLFELQNLELLEAESYVVDVENEALRGTQGGSDSYFDPVALALLQVEEIEAARRLSHCDNAFTEATQDTVNRLAEELLSGTPSGLGPDDDSPWSIGPPMPDDAEVEDLPGVQDDRFPVVAERLGRVEQSLTLPDGRQLVKTSGTRESLCCLAIVGAFSQCIIGEPVGGWSSPFILAGRGLLVLTNLPPEAVVAEYGGVFRRIENGLVFFDDSDESVGGGVRYYDADGRQISGTWRTDDGG